jgi:hypothetical protein
MNIKEKEVVDEACRGSDNNRMAGDSVLDNYHITEKGDDERRAPSDEL